MENLNHRRKNIMKQADQLKVGQIFQTSEYEIFKFLKKENREPSNSQINQIIFSLNKKNLMEDFPVIVTEDMKVLDGQGRVLACKKLDIPVCYKITKNMTIDDIPLINSVHTKWKMHDYLKKYVEQKNINYIKFERFMEKANLTTNILANLSFFPIRGATKQVRKDGRLKISHKPGHTKDGCEFGEAPASMTAEFRLGLFEYPINDGYAWKRVDVVKSFSGYMANLHQMNFVKSVICLMEIEDYDHERMLLQLKKCGQFLVPCKKQIEYFDLFNKIYNHGKSDSAYVPLRYRSVTNRKRKNGIKKVA